MHFLSSPDEDEEDYVDYLHFDAGILTSGESQKQKIQKFKPHRSQNSIIHHHGAFQRTDHHGWVPHGSLLHGHHNSPLGYPNGINIPSTPAIRPRRRPSGRTLSGHRHSWQEPSDDLFTLDEELPQIIVSDYDAPKNERLRSDSFIEPSSMDDDSKTTSIVTDHNDNVTQSPRLGASVPVEQPDVNLNQMWFAERARL
jgi:hypothetical protein